MGESSQIQKFYKDTNVFITGGTGFMGKVLIEKLLRSTQVSTIYVLVREKKGKSVDSRIDELFEDLIFDRLRSECPKFKHRIEAVPGDCSITGLGLKQADRQTLMSKVHVVFHVAATVRFDENLKLSYNINVNGIKDVVELAKQMPLLKSLVHVSTAYSNCFMDEIEEKFYDYPVNYEDIGNILEKLSPEEADEMTPKLLGKWPNTYSFTKAMAENFVRECSEGLPVGVFRPSIVISTNKEPIKAWVDNFYGPTGVCAGTISGILHIALCDPDAVADLVPVDSCVAGLIASAWDVNARNAERTKDNIPIYNYVSSVQNPLTWNEFLILNTINERRYPLSKTFYLSFITSTRNWSHFWFVSTFLHFLPALLVDTLAVITGQRPKMLSVYKKIHKFMEVISYFSLRSWKFSNKNVMGLWARCNEADKELFPFNMADVNWVQYFHDYIKGVRIYIMNDPLSTVEAAKKRRSRFEIMHLVLKFSLTFAATMSLWTIISRVPSTFPFFLK